MYSTDGGTHVQYTWRYWCTVQMEVLVYSTDRGTHVQYTESCIEVSGTRAGMCVRESQDSWEVGQAVWGLIVCCLAFTPTVFSRRQNSMRLQTVTKPISGTCSFDREAEHEICCLDRWGT